MADSIKDLREYQADLEIQNKALRYSQQAAEGALERFSALFSNVPLALMVVDEQGLVLESNAMALRLFRPRETDPPLNFLLPLVSHAHVDVVARALAEAKTAGVREVSEIIFQADAIAGFTATCTSPASTTRPTNWPSSSAR